MRSGLIFNYGFNSKTNYSKTIAKQASAGPLLLIFTSSYTIDITPLIEGFNAAFSYENINSIDLNNTLDSLTYFLSKILDVSKIPGYIHDICKSIMPTPRPPEISPLDRDLIRVADSINHITDFRENVLLPAIYETWQHFIEDFWTNYEYHYRDLSYLPDVPLTFDDTWLTGPMTNDMEGRALDLLYRISTVRHYFVIYGNMGEELRTLVHSIETIYSMNLDFHFSPVDLPGHIVWFITRNFYPAEHFSDSAPSILDFYTRVAPFDPTDYYRTLDETVPEDLHDLSRLIPCYIYDPIFHEGLIFLAGLYWTWLLEF